MRWLLVFLKRFASFFAGHSRDAEFDEELQTHLEFHIEQNLRAGMAPERARREALLKLGGLSQTKGMYRERRSLPFLETLAQDLRFAVRTLLKSPGFTLVVVVTLAFGIGANTAIFSLVNSVLLRPLSYKSPDQLYVIREIVPQWSKTLPILDVNLPDFLIWRKECRSFDQLAVAEPLEMDFSGAGEAEEIRGIRSSANLLETLGAYPALGRSFFPEEDQAGHDSVLILTDGFWRSHFHADPQILRRSITLDGVPHAVVGILPPHFHFPKAIGSLETFGPRVDFFKPLGGVRFYEEDLISEFDFTAIGRLKQGITSGQALSELNVIQAEIARQANENVDLSAALFPLEPEVVGPARKGLLLLLAAVGAVLLIVCVNLANLLLARAPSRMREAAIRGALGASPARLMRQMLTESLVLATVGGVAGIALAYLGVAGLVASGPANLPRLDEVSVDGRVLAFAFALSTAVGLVVGILPALRISRGDPQEALKSGATTATENHRPRRIRQALVACEVGVCTALLVLAGLLTSSLFRVLQVNPGFATDRVLAADVDLPPQSYAQVQARANFYNRVLLGLRAIPGVESAGWVTVLPLEGQGSVSGISLPGEPSRPSEALHANYRAVSPDYFRTMAIPLIQGRLFDDNDHGKKVIVVSKTVADRLWPGQDPLGRECLAEWGELQNSRVVGVVGDIHSLSLESPPLLLVYVPDSYGQQTPGAPDSASIVLRTAGNPAIVAAAMRGVIQKADPNVPILSLRPMTEVVAQTVEARRFEMTLAVLFAACALLLASLGIYGVIAYNVQRRRFELGIRLALGAQPSDLVRLMLRQGLTPVVVGLVSGMGVAAAGSRLIQNLLFGVGALDPLTFVSAAFLVGTVAVAASYIPARRAMRLDPIVALRYE